MFKTKTSRIIIGIIVGFCALSFIIGQFKEETNKPRHRTPEPRRLTPTERNKTLPPVDAKLLHPYTEKELRNEIDNKHTNRNYNITSILYHNYWDMNKNPRHNPKYYETLDRYEPIIGTEKSYAIMHLALHDLNHNWNQISKRFTR